MFKPLLAKPNIQWDLSKKIVIIDNALSTDVCDKLIEYGENNVQPSINKYAQHFQVSFKSCLLPLDTEVHELLQSTWETVIESLKFDIDFVEPYELKKYVDGDFFGKHIDNYYSITENVDRKITMSVQLNDSYVGGNLFIANRPTMLKRGSVVAFPSMFSHEVKPIKSGTRWSLIGWAWGPYWK